MKLNLLVSVSGGKTSMYMMKLLHDKYSATHNILNVFANTGAEHPETLDFVQRCSNEWGIKIVWVEAVVHHGSRKGATHKVVTYETASRNQEPFEEVVKKYGLPNQNYPHCNREMKLNPIHSYAMKFFNAKKRFENYQTAIGIRVDEIDRINKKSELYDFCYPLIKLGIYKSDIHDFWISKSWRLNIPEHYGNCLTCFKKSNRKIVTIAREHPEWFDTFANFENSYSNVKSPDKPRVFFRGKNTVNDVFEMAKDESIDSFVDEKFFPFDPELDVDESCSHDCSMN